MVAEVCITDPELDADPEVIVEAGEIEVPEAEEPAGDPVDGPLDCPLPVVA